MKSASVVQHLEGLPPRNMVAIPCTWSLTGFPPLPLKATVLPVSGVGEAAGSHFVINQTLIRYGGYTSNSRLITVNDSTMFPISIFAQHLALHSNPGQINISFSQWGAYNTVLTVQKATRNACPPMCQRDIGVAVWL